MRYATSCPSRVIASAIAPAIAAIPARWIRTVDRAFNRIDCRLVAIGVTDPVRQYQYMMILNHSNSTGRNASTEVLERDVQNPLWGPCVIGPPYRYRRFSGMERSSRVRGNVLHHETEQDDVLP